MAVYKRFTIQQKYLNGVPQEEYRLGMEYDPKAYHSMENCESGTECTQVEYRWIDVEGEYICEDTTKYAKQKRQQKCVDEDEWVDVYPYQYQKGEKMEEESEDCGAQPKWTTLTIGATPNSISESFYRGLIVTPSKERYNFTDTVEIKLPTISGNVLSNVNYGSTMAYGQTTDSSVLNLTMSNNWYVQANYRPMPSYYLGVGILGNGSVIVTPDNEDRMYLEGDKVKLLPIASAGYYFSNWQYGSTPTYGSTTTNIQLDLNMNNSMYALAIFIEGSPSGGLLYYSYVNGNESFINWTRSYVSYSSNNGRNANTIIDYGGVIKYLSSDAFYSCKSLVYVNFPVCSLISTDAFEDCIKLEEAIFPMCVVVGGSAFSDAWNLKSIDFPLCTTISSMAFENCWKLSKVSLPLCETVGAYAFGSCSLLGSITLPNCSSLGGHAFENCATLSYVDLPTCKSVGSYALNTYALSYVSLPQCTFVGIGAFYGCGLSSISLPKCNILYQGTFYNCRNLEYVYLDTCSYLNHPGGNAFLSGVFEECRNLKAIYLMSNSLVDIYSSSALLYRANSDVTIHVPSSLLSRYQKAYSGVYFSLYGATKSFNEILVGDL